MLYRSEGAVYPLLGTPPQQQQRPRRLKIRIQPYAVDPPSSSFSPVPILSPPTKHEDSHPTKHEDSPREEDDEVGVMREMVAPLRNVEALPEPPTSHDPSRTVVFFRGSVCLLVHVDDKDFFIEGLRAMEWVAAMEREEAAGDFHYESIDAEAVRRAQRGTGPLDTLRAVAAIRSAQVLLSLADESSRGKKRRHPKKSPPLCPPASAKKKKKKFAAAPKKKKPKAGTSSAQQDAVAAATTANDMAARQNVTFDALKFVLPDVAFFFAFLRVLHDAATAPEDLSVADVLPQARAARDKTRSHIDAAMRRRKLCHRHGAPR